MFWIVTGIFENEYLCDYCHLENTLAETGLNMLHWIIFILATFVLQSPRACPMAFCHTVLRRAKCYIPGILSLYGLISPDILIRFITRM